jgi:uncharacterized OB-fold protein
MSAAEKGLDGAPPIPVPDGDTAEFWEASAERRLVVQCCAECVSWVWQPVPLCPFCHADALVWTEVGGAGRVASWTVIHPPVLPAYADVVPFVLLLVELDEGPRMFGQLVDRDGVLLSTDGAVEGLRIDRAVELRWRESDGFTYPAWTVRPELRT